ncbi:UDP-glucose-glycoprotein glucosyltransferase Gpt1 [Schizosaccharomyces octosporus yFS286]|uniref:UDP-glucose-glycoprotein glucosyltransferase Gpt1 n=1 Tax=Schizosaccharomyces octosporus (strain yFS286) TaxID=483514 RepID=S9RAN2_SCHOY|nr:UDP-glucose-glycoprotein glucosyltransferase Gpt1 [Schizosaccharomyces octosporus yFS286]EPX75190.1 UDP-glucose-glycoprotein glucosyltransferase Gpt1 [Schizosaccharomyces octosporus yFS286]
MMISNKSRRYIISTTFIQNTLILSHYLKSIFLDTLKNLFGKMRWNKWLTFVPFLSLCFAAKPIDVKVSTAFSKPSFVALLAESLHEENRDSFLWFLDNLPSIRKDDLITDEQLYNLTVESLKADKILSQEELTTFSYSVALLSGAPKLAAFSSIVSSHAEDCNTFLVLNEQTNLCFSDLPEESLIFSENYQPSPLDYKVIGDNLSEGLPVAVIVSDFGVDLDKFHKLYSSLAKNKKCNYILRYAPSQDTELEKLYVSSFGAHASLKRTDYLVMDDREIPMSSNENNTSRIDKSKKKKEVLFDLDSDELETVTQNEIASLDLLASEAIINSRNPLMTFKLLSQDFPMYAQHLVSKVSISDDLIEDVNHLQSQAIPEGKNAIWLNGISIDLEETDAFSILSWLRKERRILSGFQKLGIEPSKASKVLSSEQFDVTEAQFKFFRFHSQDDLEDNKAIFWMNEVETDTRYSKWPKSNMQLLTPIYPGQLHLLRKQLHTVIYPIFPSSDSSISLLSELVQFSRRPSPVQTGLVCVAPEEDEFGKTICRAFHYVARTNSKPSALKFLFKCLAGDPSAGAWALVEEHMPVEDYDEETFHKIKTSLNSNIYDTILSKSFQWSSRLGLDPESQEVIVNGRIIAHDENYDSNMYSIFIEDIPEIQLAVAQEMVSEEENLLDYLLKDAPHTRNPLIYPSSKSKIKQVDMLNLLDDTGYTHSDLLTIGDKKAKYSIWLVTDFASEEGLELTTTLAEAVSKFESSNLVLVQSDLENELPALITQLSSSSHHTTEHLLKVLNKNTKKKQSKLTCKVKSKLAKYSEASKAVVAKINNPSQSVLILNGRLINSISVDKLGVQDLEMLLSHEKSNYIDKLDNALVNATELKKKGILPFVSSYLKKLEFDYVRGSVPGHEKAMFPRDNFHSQLPPSSLTIGTDNFDSCTYHFVAILDPLSKASQKWSAILESISHLDGVGVRIYLNPSKGLSDFPLSRFYRYSIEHEPVFRYDGKFKDSGVEFDKLPAETLLTMDIESRDTWVVMQEEVDIDLYNIKLEHTSSEVLVEPISAVYELKNILIQGFSQEENVKSPPRGMQLALETTKHEHFTDTIILANLGYFQLKANPGIWNLKPLPGRSSQFYTITTLNRLDSGKEKQVVLDSFEGATLYPVMRRNPGFESSDILDEDMSPQRFFDKMKKKLNFFKNKNKDPTINIFSVASGHLYERFMYIMTKSVMQHTNKKVKFWFIENFLSPSFKHSIPVLANEYGFEYEYVTYNWPEWLRKQDEKQREIWGYKILFLDVLFPLDLHKVIFVDADQIVRADLQELMDMDLQGAPYGYTPMCDSREEMEGFRFWKQGYWKKFLRGLKYHISALYVVDLDRFRKMSAGDLLRRQYQLLSADPNSLSNLDQDLPNNLQHLIPIHSLPQEWLWCETWCDDQSLKKAKTIDLCQNPLTKEKKLDRARRQVSEWTTYDNEISAMLRNAEESRLAFTSPVQDLPDNNKETDEL